MPFLARFFHFVFFLFVVFCAARCESGLLRALGALFSHFGFLLRHSPLLALLKPRLFGGPCALLAACPRSAPQPQTTKTPHPKASKVGRCIGLYGPSCSAKRGEGGGLPEVYNLVVGILLFGVARELLVGGLVGCNLGHIYGHPAAA